MIAVKCPHCHVGLKVAEGKIPLGITSFKCPKCKEPIPLSLLSEKSNHQEVDSDTILVTPVKTGIGRLTVLPDADTPEQAFPLHEGKVVIGRKSNASQATMPIITADRTMSREHICIKIKKDSKGIWTVYTKQYMNCDNEGNYIDRTQRPMGIIENYSSTQAAKLLENMELGRYFNYSKPIELISYLIARIDLEGEYILDFFAGSSTTAHAVMKLDAEDGGHRKFIMVQLPEETDEKSEAYKAGYKNICEIGKERIRRAAKKIAEENPQAKFDGGFRVLKCDTSNMKDVYYNPAEYEPSLFTSLENNIKEDRTSEDLLFQVMLDLGVLLSSKIEETTIAGKRVFNVEDNYLIACFDDNVTEEVITEIAKQKPYYFVMRDSSMANDSVATNFEQIFAAYSPDTVRKVL